uniref:B-catenin 3 n=1 Tax=Schmidtea mediterranea TaxID=79327 RepID=A0A291LM11_SCHMD|nr:b-catenin 3 [Schmidtea mediterranea]
MDLSAQIDSSSIFFDWDDDSSTESDSGISSVSSDSFVNPFDHNDSSFISTVTNIAKDISLQSSSYSKALIDFTISGLISNDTFIRRSAAVFLWQLLRACNMPFYDGIETKEKMMLLLKASDDLIVSLEAALKLDSFSNQMLYWVSGCFHYISRTPFGCEMLLKNNSDILISMLNCELQAVVFYSITTLHNILLTCPCPYRGVHLTNCINNIIDKIHKPSNLGETKFKLLAICIDCLSNLSYHNNAVKIQISRHISAIQIIISNLVAYSNNEKLLLLGLKLLKILSTDQSAKFKISSNSNFAILVLNLFKSKSKMNSNVWLVMFLTLRNLSDILFQPKSDFWKVYHDVLYQICLRFDEISCLENDGLLQCAVGILANASCDCPQNKSLLVKTKVLDSILKTLSVTTDKFKLWSGETLEAMYRCLHHLCSNHERSLYVINKCLMSDMNFLTNASHIIILNSSKDISFANILSQSLTDIPISWSILRAWLGLVRHLFIHINNNPTKFKTQLKQTNFINRIIDLLSGFRRQIENNYQVFLNPISEIQDLPSVQFLNQLHSNLVYFEGIKK